jgi:hypothetical protein
MKEAALVYLRARSDSAANDRGAHCALDTLARRIGMKSKLELNDEETLELTLSIKQALSGSQVELNHTEGSAYKDRIKNRIRVLEQIVTKIDPALTPPAARPIGGAAVMNPSPKS